MATAEQGTPTPYRDAAHTYRAAGWLGVIPVPYRTKRIRAEGWTGHSGAWPSGADVQAWVDSDARDEGGGNIVLRVPPDVIGVDVDAYAGKTGGQTVTDHEQRWGPLPPTWTSTARDDGVSGIRFYRVPEGLRWPGQAGPHVEIIQTAHRYAVVWPSVHPDTGGRYRWCRPDGLASTAPPRPDELPELPDAWLVGLTGGELAEHVDAADLTHGQARDWLVAHSRPDPCRAMRTVRDRLLDEMRSGSAHESLRRLLGLVRLAEQGHRGLVEAIGAARDGFIAESTNPARTGAHRPLEEAEAEWRRSLAGAVNRVVGNPSVGDEQPDDPCDQPFAGLVAAPSEHQLADALRTAATDPFDVPAGDTGDPDRDPQQTGDSAADAQGGEHTSWWPRELQPVLDGENAEPGPDVLARTDDQHLFYRGKVNGLLGESESGKTWVALLAVAQALEAGLHVLYLDFEDSAAGIIGRLIAMGVDRQAILERFTYVDPDEDLHALAAADLAELLAGQGRAVIVIDGVNAAMSLLGLDINDNGDATRFSQKLLRPLARTGAAVITIDHVGKNKDTRGKGGIGAQAKRAMVTGCALSVEVSSPFGRGQTGRLRLTVDKDRGGHVRGVAENGKFVGCAVMKSNETGDAVTVSVEPPSDSRASSDAEKFRPTGVMGMVSQFLSTTDGEVSGKQIETGVAARASVVRAAVDRLVEDGYVARHTGPRNAILHRQVRRYSELSDLVDGGDDDA